MLFLINSASFAQINHYNSTQKSSYIKYTLANTFGDKSVQLISLPISEDIQKIKKENEIYSKLPYNGCGGGCISNNGRCCGTCTSEDKGKQANCPQDYACVSVENLFGIKRYECWHYGVDYGNIIGNAFGVDLEDSIQNGLYFKIFKQIKSQPLTLVDGPIPYENETTVVGWDSVMESGYNTLKYYFLFYDSNDSLIYTRIYQE